MNGGVRVERDGPVVTVVMNRPQARNAINQRLKKFGFNTFTQEEITAQIAQAEIEAHFRNDPDAAINASKKVGADFILRGVISSRTAINPVLRIPEVYISMGFTLTAADGKTISDAGASADSYSGTDTLGMALTHAAVALPHLIALPLLPLMLLETLWKTAAILLIILPAWLAHRMTPDMQVLLGECIGIVVVWLVMPWRYVWARYALHPAEAWRSPGNHGPAAGKNAL